MKPPGEKMKFDEKLVRGKSILTPAGSGENPQYNLLHILGGTFLLILIPLAAFFVSGRNAAVLYAAQYAAAALVGTGIGYLAGCVPAITLLVILFAVTGKVLFALLGGRMGSFGSAEFTFRLMAWMAYASVLFGAAYAGAKARERRRTGGAGTAG